MESAAISGSTLQTRGSKYEAKRKFRRRTSSGSGPSFGQDCIVSALRRMWTRRSWIIGTQLIPPSDSTIRIPGNRRGTYDHNQSVTARIEVMAKRVLTHSPGESLEGIGVQEADPTCRFSTVPVSSQAAKNGS